MISKVFIGAISSPQFARKRLLGCALSWFLTGTAQLFDNTGILQGDINYVNGCKLFVISTG